MKKILTMFALICFFLSSNPAVAALRFGTFGTAGGNQNLQIKQGTGIDSLNTFTYAAWIYPGVLGNGGIISKQTTTSNGRRFVLNGTNGSINCRVSGTVATNYSSNASVVATSTWSFVACTFQNAATTKVHLFEGDVVNKIVEIPCLTCTNGNTPAADTGSPMFIGNSSAAKTGGLGGDIAWVGVWNRVLTVGELREQQFFPHPTSGCVVMLNLGNPSSTYVPNLCNGNNTRFYATTSTATLSRNSTILLNRR